MAKYYPKKELIILFISKPPMQMTLSVLILKLIAVIIGADAVNLTG